MATKDIPDWAVCEAADYGHSILQFLCELTSEHYKVGIRAIERAGDRGLVDLDTPLAKLSYNGRRFLAAERKQRTAADLDRVAAVRRKLDAERAADELEERQAHAARMASVRRWLDDLQATG